MEVPKGRILIKVHFFFFLFLFFVATQEESCSANCAGWTPTQALLPKGVEKSYIFVLDRTVEAIKVSSFFWVLASIHCSLNNPTTQRTKFWQRMTQLIKTLTDNGESSCLKMYMSFPSLVATKLFLFCAFSYRPYIRAR